MLPIRLVAFWPCPPLAQHGLAVDRAFYPIYGIVQYVVSGLYGAISLVEYGGYGLMGYMGYPGLGPGPPWEPLI